MPDVFFDVSKTVSTKLKAMEAYGSEIRPMPHPRSGEAIRVRAQYLGIQVGVAYAEGFKSVRVIR